MQEDFLHYIWKHSKFSTINLKTSDEEVINIISNGQHNLNAGPDFFNAQIRIGTQLWAGNVEIHVKSSDWFLHNHEQDKNYDNVILHVVWEHDADVFRKDNSTIPTLVLKEVVSVTALNNYNKLIHANRNWINCENDIDNVDDFTITHWLERLYLERLERKSIEVVQLLEASKNNWEAVLFKMLAKSFGLKVNGTAFLSLANSFDFSILRKSQSKPVLLESLLFGQSKLLEDTIEEPYYQTLQQEYQYLKQKFSLNNKLVVAPSFFRLRPNNFPTIRLSQLANLYANHQNLFSKIIEATSSEDIKDIFNVGSSAFWNTHYTFYKSSKDSKKIISKSFIDLLIINTLIPLKFSYSKYKGGSNEEAILELISQIPSEKNKIVEKFNTIKKVSENALQSQALIQLKNEYCNKNQCLKCAIGNKLLNR
ncbi:DUF2851 family protein [Hyunsoonleella pacifica]|uniref:DUF2851 family protein n=1 Tax=Hyunsoonleella pacifica TaxID=1080224 RepID=A0A4V2JAR7_9FLAO|nr:DUF2851 family protein [Hyunsoonleella pacifica]TBN13940.1 DUF2851 family protein [Hyunsoonleella pacifica]GGD26982.1 hypothetical protein GCM10011368_31250 [Hyunsoonleella pacifica]